MTLERLFALRYYRPRYAPAYLLRQTRHAALVLTETLALLPVLLVVRFFAAARTVRCNEAAAALESRGGEGGGAASAGRGTKDLTGRKGIGTLQLQGLEVVDQRVTIVPAANWLGRKALHLLVTIGESVGKDGVGALLREGNAATRW